MSETLFGGGGGNIPSNKKLRNMDITPLEYTALRKPTANTLGAATTGTGQLSLAGIPEFGGNFAAGATDQEMSLINQLFGRAGQGSQQAGLDSLLSMFAGGGSALQQAGQQNILDTLGGRYLDPSTNPWLKATADAAAGDLQYDWENRVMPNLRTSFTGKGQTVTPGSFGSSAFDRAGALAANEQTRQMQDMLTQIYGENYANERNRQLEALGLGQQATQQQIGAQTAGLTAQQGQQGLNQAERAQQTQELVTTLQSVALPRLIEQYGIDQGVEQFRTRLNTLLQLLGIQAGVTGASIANVQPSQGSSGIFGSLLSAGGNIGAAALA